MGIRTSWDNAEQTAIRFDYEGAWTWDDLHKALEESHSMMRSVSQTVDVIIDVSRSQLIPSGALARGKYIEESRPANHGSTAVVGANGFMQGLYDLFRKIYRKDMSVMYVSSLEEARARLLARRQLEVT